MREKVLINDVGPRDGLQNQPRVLTVTQRVQLIQALINAGVRSVEAGAFVSPKAVPAMAGTDAVLAGLPVDAGIDFQVLVPNLKGYQLARSAGATTVVLVVCASETMNQRNVRMSVEESLAQAREICAAARLDGVRVVTCIAVAWHCPFEGATEPGRVLDLAGRLFAMGAQDVNIADTIGAATPMAVGNLMGALAREYSTERLACHFHDTRAFGLANVYAALETGIRKFDSSVGGIGGCPFAPGATGNVASEDVVMLLEQMGFDTGIDLPLLMAAGQLVGGMLDTTAGGRADAWRRLQLEKGAEVI
ncbi:hydroxymethylglutaryl-CoA lyase [Microbulbifer hydrolyticus]|uniref:Hydroxymethylglutaryl-CoA lyase n=1 Tax=Microbulbifer hydrolyticus TaxID=48074 RepID=A0A6P1TC71_9GAMM|nr:hydroxymethylglutaryl-CoA lyase [Microbulbifer hydrolyticus]MBB5210160.1 hydroxymethylglutaryl-CoA lyase [Microbulbifer hydrolyticus]QHQ39325.1 hydroxymethylglutaryl-CoA lyase [Microbulbifer hydrolyticus]